MSIRGGLDQLNAYDVKVMLRKHLKPLGLVLVSTKTKNKAGITLYTVKKRGSDTDLREHFSDVIFNCERSLTKVEVLNPLLKICNLPTINK